MDNSSHHRNMNLSTYHFPYRGTVNKWHYPTMHKNHPDQEPTDVSPYHLSDCIYTDQTPYLPTVHHRI